MERAKCAILMFYRTAATSILKAPSSSQEDLVSAPFHRNPVTSSTNEANMENPILLPDFHFSAFYQKLQFCCSPQFFVFNRPVKVVSGLEERNVKMIDEKYKRSFVRTLH